MRSRAEKRSSPTRSDESREKPGCWRSRWAVQERKTAVANEETLAETREINHTLDSG